MFQPKHLIFIIFYIISINATVTILQPRKTDFLHNEVNYSFANFGSIHYGKAYRYSLVVANETYCEQGKLPHFKKPTYVVVMGNLSQCSYPNKAITAQNLGAHGIMFGST